MSMWKKRPPLSEEVQTEGRGEARRLRDISSLRLPFNIQVSRSRWHLAVWGLSREMSNEDTFGSRECIGRKS